MAAAMVQSIFMVEDYAIFEPGAHCSHRDGGGETQKKHEQNRAGTYGDTFAAEVRMNAKELRVRTKQYAIAIIKFAKTLPSDAVTIVLSRQMVKSGTSVGANYRSACRAKSKRDFIAKLAFVEEEADETQYWLELLVESGVASAESVKWLRSESEQLVRIVVASINTARGGPR